MPRALEPEDVAFDLEETYRELKDRALDEGALKRSQWDDLVDEVLDDKMEFQVLDDDADWSECREVLKSKFDEFSEEVGEV